MGKNFDSRLSNKGKKVRFENPSSGWKSKPYDEIGPIHGQYMQTRNGKNYGFIDIFKDICEPKYLSISPLFMLNVHGFVTAMDVAGWTLVNTEGVEIFKKRFKEIYIYSDELVVLKDFNGSIKLFFPQFGIVSKEEFTDVEPKHDYVRTFYEQKQGIYLYDGTCILNAKYQLAIPFGEDTFKGITFRGLEVVNKKGWKNPTAEVEKIFPEVCGFFRAENIEDCPTLSRKFAFISGETGEYITGFDFSEARDFRRSGIAIVRDFTSKRMKALEPSGKVRESHSIKTPQE